MVRMLMAGIESNKISYSFNPMKMADEFSAEGIDTIYLLFDVYNVPAYKKVLKDVKQICQREVV